MMVCDVATDEYFMGLAMRAAEQGAALGEVPVGALIVHDNQVIAQGFNCPISHKDSTAHAEIIAIRQACRHFDNYRLPADCTLYVTLEPCSMCLGAMIHARVGRLVYGASEPKAGVITSQEDFLSKGYFNHSMQVTGGVLAQACGQLLSDFFKIRRAHKKSIKQQA